jgi:hypothetical protein
MTSEIPRKPVNGSTRCIWTIRPMSTEITLKLHMRNKTNTRNNFSLSVVPNRHLLMPGEDQEGIKNATVFM